LNWVDGLGGWQATRDRSLENAAALRQWMAGASWVDELAIDPATRSITSVCLKIVDPWFTGFDTPTQAALIKEICAVLEREDVAFDIASYRDAPPGLRIWCGATIDRRDIAALGPWLDWAYHQVKSNKAGV
jgi:phosphoserine aminotransferase